MAKNDNLQDFLTDIADTIREKKGTTDKINPQDFAQEISKLSEESGSSESKEPIVINKVYEIAAFTLDHVRNLHKCVITKVFNSISSDNIYTNYGALGPIYSGSIGAYYVTWYMPMDENYELLDSFFCCFSNQFLQTNLSKEEMFQKIDSLDIYDAQQLIEPILTAFASMVCVCARNNYNYDTTLIYSSMYEHFSDPFMLYTNDILLNAIGIKVDGSKIGLNNILGTLTAVDATEFPTITVDNGLYNVFKDWILDRFPNNGQALVNEFINNIN